MTQSAEGSEQAEPGGTGTLGVPQGKYWRTQVGGAEGRGKRDRPRPNGSVQTEKGQGQQGCLEARLHAPPSVFVSSFIHM